ncbi:hypothetical protein PN36_11930 [Candidatus Thiomargarita nelsonii]|uniref:HicB-like antitoxin of toxin-antitoxin system domain-containing protein n=1 Tax=Candidatus Thiomargarita nelsonii TaxID=1003181 RepID=A0A0A6RNI3_9GAMM|nr:hypothetical protein PN36_11930 [Candidatus Thiomargarita nelsonii]
MVLTGLQIQSGTEKALISHRFNFDDVSDLSERGEIMKYTIFITQENQGKFHAMAQNLPNCHAYAQTRHEALKAIRETITQVVNRIEMIQLDIPTQPKVGQLLDETPWQWFGAFKEDPTWGALFDEIELKRNSQVG